MKIKLLIQIGLESIVECEPKPGEAFPCGKHPLLSALQPQQQHDSTMLKMHFQSKNRIQINKAVVFNSILTNTKQDCFDDIFVLCIYLMPSRPINAYHCKKKFVKFILHSDLQHTIG